MNTIEITEAISLPSAYIETRDAGQHILVRAIDGVTFEPPLLLEHAGHATINDVICVNLSLWFTDQLIDLTMVTDTTVQWRVGDE